MFATVWGAIIGLPIWGLVLLGLLYLALCLVGWYFLAGFDYAMNSGQLGRHPRWFPFQCFAEEVRCYLPGGRKYRVDFIKTRVRGWDGVMACSSKSYTYQEIREKGLYEEVFFAMLGGYARFWSSHLFSFFVSPFLALFLLVLGVIKFVLSPFVLLWRKLFPATEKTSV